MNPSAIVTDSTNYLPASLLAEYGIEQISLHVTTNGKTVREVDVDDYDSFYRSLLASDGRPATTSQPAVGDFVEVYRRLIARGQDVFSIHISASFSGTIQSARTARAQLLECDRVDPSRIIVQDSGIAGAPLGMIVLEAAKRAKDGWAINDIAHVTEQLRSGMSAWFAVESLEFLRRGGRIGRASGWLGSALKIKPILTIGEQIEPVERVRTTGRVLQRLTEYLKEGRDAGCDRWMVQHIRSFEEAQRLTEIGKGIFGCEPAFASEVGPVVGAHLGPLVGVVTAMPIPANLPGIRQRTDADGAVQNV